jgi:hypothetical protein
VRSVEPNYAATLHFLGLTQTPISNLDFRKLLGNQSAGLGEPPLIEPMHGPWSSLIAASAQ